MNSPKPFTPNTKAKVEKMTEATTAIYTAIHALEFAKNSAENWADWETLEHFKKELQNFLSQDNGEAGFEPYLVSESDKVFPRRKNPIRQAQKMAAVYNSKGQRIMVTVPQD